MRAFIFAWCAVLGCLVIASGGRAEQPPNLLVVTVDDMSCDSIGSYGCALADTTPHLDKLAASSMRFAHAYVQVGNCMPSRNVMWSGRFPHNNRVEGFYQIKDPDYPVLADLMKEAGYFTGIRGKVPHSTPYSPYPAWDKVLDTLPDGKPAHIKDASSYHASVAQGISGARAAGKPFFLNINISDPHKPFYAEGGRPDPHVPSRVFTAAEVPVPGFLFEDPEVRRELAEYYSSVRRGDDCAGEVMRALRESGEEERTIILFLSDHGMPLPFAKTQLYFHSLRTPLMVRWPGVTKAGAVDGEHMVSAVDLLPTILEMLGLAAPEGIDGRSFLPMLRGGTQKGRDFVVGEYNENAGGDRSPMRAILTREHAYIFNPWSDGKSIMKTATQGTVTYRRMKALAPERPDIAARLALFEHRVVEELYDYSYDPDALTNLIASPAHAAAAGRLTGLLEEWMERTGDPLLEVFRERHDPAAREAFMESVRASAAGRERKPGGAGKGKAKGKGKAAPGAKAGAAQGGDHLQLSVPDQVTPGGIAKVRAKFSIHEDFGGQQLQITIRLGTEVLRDTRQVFTVSGIGEVEAEFEVPADWRGNPLRFAAFLGENAATALDRALSQPVPAAP
jgi:N-sulfoglucosamine sulfohydrolase